MLKIRSRFGARLVPAKELLADFLRRRGIVRAVAMNADQAPVSTDKRYWTQFLGQDTAFYIVPSKSRARRACPSCTWQCAGFAAATTKSS